MKANQSRRNFIRKAAFGAAGAAVLGQIGFGSCKNVGQKAASASGTASDIPPIGLQLYTVRDGIEVDLESSLKKVSKIGYKELELAGYADGKFYGKSPAEFKKMVEDLGMNVVSSHTGVEIKGVDTSNAEALAEAHAQLGVKYCVKPWLIEERRTSIDSYKQVAEELNTIGDIMAKYDIQFGYHNHDFEFDTVEGKIPYYDVLIPETDPNSVVLELDLYWATKAGHDPVDIFNRFPGRFGLWHVKDMEDSEDQFFAPVGSGVIDFNRIFAAQEKAGMKHFFVEQDRTREGIDPFASVETSYKNLADKILS